MAKRESALIPMVSFLCPYMKERVTRGLNLMRVFVSCLRVFVAAENNGSYIHV